MMGTWIDIHTHRPGEGVSVADACLGAVAEPAGGKVFYSRGVHPLLIDGGEGEALERVEWEAAAGEIVAVGECGLDRNGATPLPLQEEIFERQVGIAAQWDLPLVVHVVRAVPEVIAVAKRHPDFRKWVIHGFNNRREILEDLLRHGFYVSVGAKVLVEESHASRLVAAIPADRLFLETDDSGVAIEAVYAAVAARRGISVAELQEVVAGNFARLFSRCG